MTVSIRSKELDLLFLCALIPARENIRNVVTTEMLQVSLSNESKLNTKVISEAADFQVILEPQTLYQSQDSFAAISFPKILTPVPSAKQIFLFQ